MKANENGIDNCKETSRKEKGDIFFRQQWCKLTVKPI